MNSSIGVTAPNLGLFRLPSLLAEGETACVYRAWCPTLQMVVGLKVSHRVRCQPQWLVHRWRSEARLSNALQHPRVIRVDGSNLAGGFPHISMDKGAGGLATALSRTAP